MNNTELTITLPISTLVDLALGIRKKNGHTEQMWNSIEIPPLLAEIIEAKTGNKNNCYIQHADEMSPHLDWPLLWELSAWHIEYDSWMRQKIHSDKERVKRFIFEANVKIIARAIMELLGSDNFESCKLTAFSLLKNNKMGNIRAIGVTKLITREEELV